ncbi:protein-L-isoaspartate O-methyltransferase family protein [Microvirga roseola]|uniref:protein-L-isoaspartate O-methyltransferase family protein n=1 Tax=Microvirga roseola TaxID=2883126 RepID=UPI001E3B970C|nr:protein-L-isoaspartate O-methyltransferase [Microvirga roseola]
MVDFSQARRLMVDSQLRTFDVNDVAVQNAMGSIPRELFVLPGREDLAYIDQHVPVSDGAERRLMISPMILARMIQSLEIDEGDKVLDVACGRGYSSAIMASVGAQVTALEADDNLVSAAKQSLASAGAQGITVVAGPLEKGFPENAPYDAILINGAIEVRPEELLQQLAEGGRLICVKGQGRAARATLYVRSGDAFGERSLFDAAAPLLAPLAAKPSFTF